MMPLQNHYNKGFSLIEVLVALVIFGILTVMLFSSLNIVMGTWGNADTRSDVQQNNRVALDWVSMELRKAATYTITQPVIQPSISQVSSNVLSFTRPSEPLNINIPTLQTITYSLSTTDLIRQVNGGSSQVIASGINSFSVSHYLQNTTLAYDSISNPYDSRLYTITVGTVTANQGRSWDFYLITNVRLRAP
jgi:prepilin-type N-terminal cleavage/methylation domain-containing protein